MIKTVSTSSRSMESEKQALSPAVFDQSFRLAVIQRDCEHGCPYASFELGLMHFNGAGLDKSDINAKKLWEVAANSGMSEAKFNLGCMYYLGQGTEKSIQLALRYWQEAADCGLPEALYNMSQSRQSRLPAPNTSADSSCESECFSTPKYILDILTGNKTKN